jgi:UDP-N-acetylmuramoyl-L-alanyl-D-glutamate--2,6-diaminopimelate ligase
MLLLNLWDREITGITCDSRCVEPGNLFVAIRGVRVDGSRFAPDAVRRGAVAVICEKSLRLPNSVAQIVVSDARKAVAYAADAFYRFPSRKVKVLGVTGTTGKTTAVYMIAHILNACGKIADMFTTVKYQFAGESIPAPQTTPDAIMLTRMISESAKSGSEYIAMEVSSHALCQMRVEATRFHCAVFTNLSSDHLDYHVTAEAYQDAKAILFQKLSPSGWAILNADDPASKYYAEKTSAKIVRYSAKNSADVSARILSASLSGLHFDLASNGASARVAVPVIGLHNVENTLAASCACLACGLSISEIASALSTFTGVPGRLEHIETGRDFSVFVDYAHTEGALATVLAGLRPFTESRLIAVFGCGGDRDRTKRRKMAAVAEKYADVSIITNDNPRSEDPQAIIGEIEAGFARKEKYLVEEDRREAIRLSLSLAKKGDVVLIAGKGHENHQIFADRIEHFDDCEIVRESLS